MDMQAFPAPENHLRLETARWRLAAIWFPAGGLIFLILIVQTIGGVFGSDPQRAFSWALPNFLPTLALMISVFAADALKPAEGQARFVRRPFCNLAFWLSVFYLLVVLISLFGPTFSPQVAGAPDPTAARFDFMETSNVWLAPLQGLVVAALGVLFFLKE